LVIFKNVLDVKKVSQKPDLDSSLHLAIIIGLPGTNGRTYWVPLEITTVESFVTSVAGAQLLQKRRKPSGEKKIGSFLLQRLIL
jgi:hypothetical protein